MMSNHTKVVGSVAAVLFLGSILLFVTLVYVIGNLNAKLTEQKIERQRAETHQQELSSLVELVQDTTAERTELSGYVLADDKVIDFLALVEMLGSEHGVTLKTNSLNVAEKDNVFEDLQVQVSIAGPYASVLHTLSLLETLPYQSYISSLTLARDDKEGQTDAWTATLLLHVTKFKKS